MSDHAVGFVDWIKGQPDDIRKLIIKECVDTMEDGNAIKDALDEAGISAPSGETQVVEKEVVREVIKEVPAEMEELDDSFVIEWLRKQRVQNVEKIIKEAQERYLPERGFMNFFKRGEAVKLDLMAPDGNHHDVTVYPDSVGKQRVVLCLKRRGATGSRKKKAASRSTRSPSASSTKSTHSATSASPSKEDT